MKKNRTENSINFSTWCRDSMCAYVCHFAIWSFLYNYVIATGYVQIDGRQRRRNIKWYIVVLCYDGYLIRSDFIGRIPIGRNSIGADHNGSNISGS